MPVYKFFGNSGGGPLDGSNPTARVILGGDDRLYGTTVSGGSPNCGNGGCGTVFRLTPPPEVCQNITCPWTETALYAFQGNNDGANPSYGDLTFDSNGNLYGTTIYGGGGQCLDATCGTVYELSPSHGYWTENVLYSFYDESLGFNPYAGVVLDGSGNLYGTTTWGNTVYELSPSMNGWTPTKLYYFSGLNQGANGLQPMGGVVFDTAGNLYGTTTSAGISGGGTVFKLIPSGQNSTLTTVHSFFGNSQLVATGPTPSLAMDAAGNLYGTTYIDGPYQNGLVFKLSPSNGSWTYTVLHNFTGGADGGQPWGQLSMDANGNIYRTTTIGGNSVGRCSQGLGCGVVFEITP